MDKTKNQQMSVVNQAVFDARTQMGVAQELPDSHIKTFPDLFAHARQHYANNPAYQCLGHTITFQELDKLSDQFAVYIQSLDFLQKGDRVSIQLPNLLQWPIAAMAVLKSGFILVNTNPLYTAHELKHQLNDSGAKLVITLKNIATELHEIVHETRVQQVILTEVADILPPLKRFAINSALKYVLKEVPSLAFSNSVPFLQALNSGKNTHPARRLNTEVAPLAEPDY